MRCRILSGDDALPYVGDGWSATLAGAARLHEARDLAPDERGVLAHKPRDPSEGGLDVTVAPRRERVKTDGVGNEPAFPRNFGFEPRQFLFERVVGVRQATGFTGRKKLLEPHRRPFVGRLDEGIEARECVVDVESGMG